MRVALPSRQTRCFHLSPESSQLEREGQDARQFHGKRFDIAQLCVENHRLSGVRWFWDISLRGGSGDASCRLLGLSHSDVMFGLYG
jgi:hypothetical protein